MRDAAADPSTEKAKQIRDTNFRHKVNALHMQKGRASLPFLFLVRLYDILDDFFHFGQIYDGVIYAFF